MILKDGMILYHGSYTEISSIDLTLCDAARDFGKGFYTTASKEQAEAFIPTSLAKARRGGRIPEKQQFGFVTAFRVHLNQDVNCYEFESVSKDWLYYIAINRRKYLAGSLRKLLSRNFDHYDVLVGKIANDDTNITLNAFLSGTFGNIEDDMAYEIVTRLLRPERLESQFCFKSEQAIKMLEKTGAVKYEIRQT